MELLAACQMIFNVISNQPLSVQDHQKLEQAYVQVAPKCVEEFKKAQEKEKKK